MTLEELDAFEEQYLKEMASPETRGRWPEKAYCTTKMFLSTYTSILGRRDSVLEKGIQVYSMHPGWCRTDMTKHYEEKGIIPPMSKEEGAETAIYLCDLPFKIDPKLQGEYFSDSAHGSLIE